jgi:hypothetical protein
MRVSEPILVVDVSRVVEDKGVDVRRAFDALAAFVEETEAEPLAYNVYLDGTGTRVTVVQLHPSSESLEHHMDVAGPRFAAFAELLRLERIDVYGAPSEGALQRLRRKADLLGSAPVTVNELQAGFIRMGAAQPTAGASAGQPEQ